MMIKYIVVALIVSVDSFFVALLVSERTMVNILALLVSPFLHIVFCLSGFLMQQNLDTFVGKSLLGIVVLIVLIAGSYLVLAYKPKIEAMRKRHHIRKTSVCFTIILILFCSLDALIAGFIYGYWEIGLKEASICMGEVNLAVIFCAILIGKVLSRSKAQLPEKC